MLMIGKTNLKFISQNIWPNWPSNGHQMAQNSQMPLLGKGI